MHLFLYEWATGGGLVEEAGPPSSLGTEGAAMVDALAADFVRLDACRVSLLRDPRFGNPNLPGCNLVEVDSCAHAQSELHRLAALSDHTLIIAPELDGILTRAVGQLQQRGRPLLNAPRDFVALATDKQQTAQRLAAAGVPVPEAVCIPADETLLPADFLYPGVLKPIDGAGSQHTLLVEDHRDQPPPYPWPRRLERYIPGRPASVLFFCGPHCQIPLPACWQRLSADSRFTYLGGATIEEPRLSERATILAARALAAMPPAAGPVGVDLVLGDAEDASGDVVIEINPRLTTSYVGLRAAVAENLAGAMLEALAGTLREFTRSGAAIEFSAAGHVRRRTE